jgi:sugar O-acyltransferase (sialic acid O-acetyltransferase NeuD family)
MSGAIILWGHAKVLRELLERIGHRIVAVFDNDPHIEPPFADVPLFRGSEGFRQWRERNPSLRVAGLAAIGGSRGADRLERQAFFDSQGIETPQVVVHPTAFLAASATCGRACQVLAQAAVCVDVRMGEACIINTRSSVDHECVLGNGVHIGPGATLAGCVTVGDLAFVGAGAVVLPRTRIGRNAIVGAGSIVTRDVPDGKTVYGNPASGQARTGWE